MDELTLAVVGAGGLGQVIAARLAAAGEPVWLLATPRAAAELRAAGAIELIGIWPRRIPIADAPERNAVALRATPSGIDGVGPMLFATKAHQLADAARFWSAIAPRWVAGLQNGMAKDDILAAVYGPERVVGATTIVGAERAASGPVRHTGTGHTYFGELTGSAHDLAAVVDAFARAGLPATLDPDIRSAEWSKAANAAAAFAVSVLTRLGTRAQRADADLARAYLLVAGEVAAIAAAEGVALGDYERFPVRRYLAQDEAATIAEFAEHAARMPPAADHPNSMLQDLLAGRPLEVEPVFGDLVARAARHAVAAPTLGFVYRLIRALDPARGPSEAGRPT